MDEKKITQTVKNVYNEKSMKDVENCPDEEKLASYIDGQCNKEVTAEIEKHILDCNSCSKRVAMTVKECSSSDTDIVEEVSESTVEKVKDFIPERDGNCVWDIIISIARDSLKILDAAKDFIIQPELVPVLLRKEDKLHPSKTVRLKKSVEDIDMDIEIQSYDKNKCKLGILFCGKDRNVLNNIRVSLLFNNREVGSCVTRNGKVFFDDLTESGYQIKIIRNKEKIGIINLKIKE